MKKLSFSAIRYTGPRAARWLGLLLAAIAGGMILGDMAVGTRHSTGTAAPASYSHLSANPGALVADGEGAAPCPDCADSYGVAARLRANREDRMSDDFRALGAVDAATVLPPEPVDDGYRYGGRFPDPPPVGENPVAARDAAMEAPDGAPADGVATLPVGY